MQIRHLVHSCLLVEIAGQRLLIDPGGFSARSVRSLPPTVLAGIDAVAVTHLHPDHLDRELLQDVLAQSPQALVLAEPQTAELLAQRSEDGIPAVPAPSLRPLPAGSSREIAGRDGASPVTVQGVGGRHAVIHPDIPRVGNTGLVISAGKGPRLGVTGDSLEAVAEFVGIDALAFAVVAPWSKMSETIDFLRAVRPRVALPVHEAVASEPGRAIYLRQAAAHAPEGTRLHEWPAEDPVARIPDGGPASPQLRSARR